MTDEECSSLAIYNDPEGIFCLSAWKPSLSERLSILFFGRVWVWVLSGHTQPPISLLGTRTVFPKKAAP
jgi:hypothetical protein